MSEENEIELQEEQVQKMVMFCLEQVIAKDIPFTINQILVEKTSNLPENDISELINTRIIQQTTNGNFQMRDLLTILTSIQNDRKWGVEIKSINIESTVERGDDSKGNFYQYNIPNEGGEILGGEVNLLLSLNKPKNTKFTFGTEVSTDGSTNISGSVERKNFLGWDDIGSIKLQNNTKSGFDYQAALTLPLEGGDAKQLSYSLFSHKDIFEKSSFSANNVGTRLAYETLSGQTYSFESEWRENKIHDNTISNVAFEGGHSLKVSAKHQYRYDTRNDFKKPTSGLSYRSLVELAGFGGTEHFFKAEQHFQPNFLLPWKGWSVNFITKIGAIYPLSKSNIRINDRFFLGGPNLLRGFEHHSVGVKDQNNYLGGNFFYSQGIHLNFPLPQSVPDPISAHAFINSGAVIKTLAGQSIVDGVKESRVAAGIGLVFNTAIGRIELNLNYPIFARGDITKDTQLGRIIMNNFRNISNKLFLANSNISNMHIKPNGFQFTTIVQNYRITTEVSIRNYHSFHNQRNSHVLNTQIFPKTTLYYNNASSKSTLATNNGDEFTITLNNFKFEHLTKPTVITVNSFNTSPIYNTNNNNVSVSRTATPVKVFSFFKIFIYLLIISLILIAYVLNEKKNSIAFEVAKTAEVFKHSLNGIERETKIPLYQHVERITGTKLKQTSSFVFSGNYLLKVLPIKNKEVYIYYSASLLSEKGHILTVHFIMDSPPRNIREIVILNPKTSKGYECSPHFANQKEVNSKNYSIEDHLEELNNKKHDDGDDFSNRELAFSFKSNSFTWHSEHFPPENTPLKGRLPLRRVKRNDNNNSGNNDKQE